MDEASFVDRKAHDREMMAATPRREMSHQRRTGTKNLTGMESADNGSYPLLQLALELLHQILAVD